MTVISLDQAEWKGLHTQFLLKKGEARHQDHSMRAIDLLAPQTCADLLDSLTAVIGSPSRRTTASLLSKRIPFLTTGASLYAMSMYGKGLDFSLENCYLEYQYAYKRWQSGMPLDKLAATMPLKGSRAEWRRQVIAGIFAGNLSRLWQSLSSVAKVPVPVLWENTAVRVYSLYERPMALNSCAGMQSRIQEDFNYLVRDASPELFGAARNPLAEFFRPSRRTRHSAQPVRIRKTCCYYYQTTAPREYCSICPLHRT